MGTRPHGIALIATCVLWGGDVASAAPPRQVADSRPVSYSENWGREGDNTSAFIEFRAWTETASVVSTSSIARGIALAKNRRAALEQLIISDPQRAISLAAPSAVRQKLPPEILAELETFVAGTGDLHVIAAEAAGGAPRPGLERIVALGGKSYRAFTYGRRLGQTSKEGVPLHGISLGYLLALHDSPGRELTGDELNQPAARVIDVPARGASAQPVAVQIGESVYRFPSRQQMQAALGRLAEDENILGPDSNRTLENAIFAADEPAPTPTPSTTPRPWTHGLKRVLLIRVDFRDIPGVPIDNARKPLTRERGLRLINTTASGFLEEVSRGKTSLTGVVTRVLRMPRTGYHYAMTPIGSSELLDDARAAARAAGYRVPTFDRVIVAFSNITPPEENHFPYAALGSIAGRFIWLNAYFGPAVVEHELGHTYGLNHANGWVTSDGSVTGPGTSQEYMDRFDTMGYSAPIRGSDHRKHFNPWFQRLLGWLDKTEVQIVTETSTHRVYAFDQAGVSGIQALRVPKDAERSYWISYRTKFDDDPNMSNGAYIVMGYPLNGPTRPSDLLDMTPTDSADGIDVALQVGQTLHDPVAGVSFTTVRKGGVAPYQFLDIRVTVAPTSSAATELRSE